MEREKILECLCIRDKRNPEHKDVFSELEDFEIPKPKVDCFCDNCFHGRTELAEYILSLIDPQ